MAKIETTEDRLATRVTTLCKENDLLKKKLLEATTKYNALVNELETEDNIFKSKLKHAILDVLSYNAPYRLY